MRAVWRSIVLLGAVMLAASCTSAQVKGGDDRLKVAKIGS
jgi:hypothetical protein